MTTFNTINTPQQQTSPTETAIVSDVQTGAQILLSALVKEQVETVFGMPGGVILSIYQALPDYPIHHVLVRHEQGGAHMAEGYARASGKPGIVFATSGPGATNLVTALADAYYDSVPLIAFTGNVLSTMLGNDAFQEADIAGITRPVTKHNIVVRHVADLAQAIKEAFHVATTGRPGPVLVDIPKDVLLDSAPFNYEETMIDLPGYTAGMPECLDIKLTDTKLEALMDLVAAAKQPLLLLGGGVISSGAHQEALAFAEQLQLPVASSLMGLGSFPANHPLYLGFCGMHGHYWSNIAIAQADVLLVVGNRLGDRQTGKADRFAKNAQIIHLDLDPTSLEKNVQTTLPIQGDIRQVLQALISKIANSPTDRFTGSLGSRAQWFAKIESWKQRREKSTASPTSSSLAAPDFLTPQHVIDRLFHWLPEDGFVTTEVGQHQMWAAQRFNLSRPRSFITSGGLGTMGFGFPAAIGVQAAFPDKTVVDIAGDGSFQMTLQELATARDQGLPVKVAIINNGFLGMVRQWQDKTWNRDSQSRMSSPDYVKLAEAYGCAGFLVTHPDEVDDVIQQAYQITDRPVLIDFHVQDRADVYPWVPAGAANDEMLTNDNQQ
jgi:acetolactate synthase I/II/III large subunit